MYNSSLNIKQNFVKDREIKIYIVNRVWFCWYRLVVMSSGPVDNKSRRFSDYYDLKGDIGK